jgi:hypothetical protein
MGAELRRLGNPPGGGDPSVSSPFETNPFERGNPFFGQRHDAPRYDEADQVPTPAGWECLHCDEAIEEGDDGWLMGAVSMFQPTIRAVHRECDLLHVLGHAVGVCHCHDEEFEGWSERERAREVLRRIESGRPA